MRRRCIFISWKGDNFLKLSSHLLLSFNLINLILLKDRLLYLVLRVNCFKRFLMRVSYLLNNDFILLAKFISLSDILNSNWIQRGYLLNLDLRLLVYHLLLLRSFFWTHTLSTYWLLDLIYYYNTRTLFAITSIFAFNQV